MAPEYSIWDSLVCPESEDLYVAFLVIESIQVTSDPSEEYQDVEDEAGQQLRLVAGKTF